jgi:hypothetical protein
MRAECPQPNIPNEMSHSFCMKNIHKFQKYKREQLMKKLIERFSGLVKSTLSGFDRIVFKGLILTD